MIQAGRTLARVSGSVVGEDGRITDSSFNFSACIFPRVGSYLVRRYPFLSLRWGKIGSFHDHVSAATIVPLGWKMDFLFADVLV
jgi:hypothetical protein